MWSSKRICKERRISPKNCYMKLSYSVLATQRFLFFFKFRRLGEIMIPKLTNWRIFFPNGLVNDHQLFRSLFCKTLICDYKSCDPKVPSWDPVVSTSNLGVSENSGFSQIIHFNMVFHDFHPSILGYIYIYPYFCRKPPNW